MNAAAEVAGRGLVESGCPVLWTG